MFLLFRGPHSTPRTVLQQEKNGTTYMATFVPSEVGVHDVFVSAAGEDGTPIEKAFQTRICNAKAVVPLGSSSWTSILDDKGYGRFEAGSQTVLELDTSQAGPGYMQAEVLTQYGEVKSKVEASRDNRSVCTNYSCVQNKRPGSLINFRKILI